MTTASPNLVSFFVQCVSHFKGLMIGQFFVAVIWAVDFSLRPYLVKIIINKVSTTNQSEAFSVLGLLIFLYIFISLFSACTERFYDFIWLKLNSGLKKHVGLKLMEHITAQSYNFYQNSFAGSLSNKIKDLMSGMPDLSRILIDKMFSHVLALIISIYTILCIKPVFAMTLTLWIIIYLTSSLKLSLTSRKLFREAAKVRSSVIGYLVDVLGNMVSVWLFNTKTWEKRKLSSVLQKYVDADQARDWFFLKIYSVQSLSFIIYQIACLFWLILGFKEGWVTPGDFALVLTLNISIVNCLSNLSKDINICAELVGNITEGLNTIYAPLEIQDQPNAKELVVTQGNIIFNKVDFNHHNNVLLFKNKSIEIKSKQKIGLVGYSGSGKSTFINLLLRLFDVSSGSILIDGQDIRTVTLDSLRRSIALIPQDPSLFHRSLMENIKYGNVLSTDEEVIEASKKAYAHEFIMALPEGYNSLVGERGIKLSGGQRQRIAIARAILKNAPILILDEATSNLDSIIEGYIQRPLSELMKNKTTFVIAHRLSTLLYMDRILVFDSGRIVEDGSHLELLQHSKLYKTLWEKQVAQFYR